MKTLALMLHSHLHYWYSTLIKIENSRVIERIWKFECDLRNAFAPMQFSDLSSAKFFRTLPFKMFGPFWSVWCKNGCEAKSLHPQIPPLEKASRKIPPEENISQQNASTLKCLPTKHLQAKCHPAKYLQFRKNLCTNSIFKSKFKVKQPVEYC